MMTPHLSTGPSLLSKADQYRQMIDLEDAANFRIFHYFPKLAPELRLKILKLCLVPRLVDIQLIFKSEHSDYQIYYSPYCANGNLISNTPVPAILQVDRESRVEMLKLYQTISYEADTHKGAGRFYFNYSIDTLYLPYRVPSSYDRETMLTIESLHPDTRVRLKKLAVDEIVHSQPLRALTLIATFMHQRMVGPGRTAQLRANPVKFLNLQKFRGLKQITMVAFHPLLPILHVSMDTDYRANIGQFGISDIRGIDDGEELIQKVSAELQEQMEKVRGPPSEFKIFHLDVNWSIPPIKVMRPAELRVMRKRSKTV